MNIWSFLVFLIVVVGGLLLGSNDARFDDQTGHFQETVVEYERTRNDNEYLSNVNKYLDGRVRELEAALADARAENESLRSQLAMRSMGSPTGGGGEPYPPLPVPNTGYTIQPAPVQSPTSAGKQIVLGAFVITAVILLGVWYLILRIYSYNHQSRALRNIRGVSDLMNW